MDKKEKRYLIALFASLIVLAIMGIVSFVYTAAAIYQEGSMNNNILEFFYLGMHLVIVCAALIFSWNSLKTGSYIMRNLMYSKFGRRSTPALIISGTLALIGYAVCVYFALVLFHVPLPNFNFPIALIVDLVNSPLTLGVVATFFFFSSFVFPYHFPDPVE